MLAYWNKGTLDLVELCSELGIEIDFSRSTNVMNLFSSNTVLTRVGTIDTRKAPNINATFQYCSALHTIEKLILKDDGTTAFNIETFRNCSALINLTIEGVIGLANYNMQWSTQLSADSIDSVINALSSTTSGLTVTLSKTAVDAACKVREGSSH